MYFRCVLSREGKFICQGENALWLYRSHGRQERHIDMKVGGSHNAVDAAHFRKTRTHGAVL